MSEQTAAQMYHERLVQRVTEVEKEVNQMDVHQRRGPMKWASFSWITHYIKTMPPKYTCPNNQSFCQCKNVIHYCCYYGKRLLLLRVLNVCHPKYVATSLQQKIQIHGKMLQPISAAVQTGQIDCITSLLRHKPASLELDFGLKDAWDAANLAVDCGRLSTLNLILESICDRKSSGFREMSKGALVNAVDKGFHSAAHLLINHGADITGIMRSSTSDDGRKFVIEQAVKYENPSLEWLVNEIIKKDDIQCLKYLLQGPYSFMFDLNNIVDGETPLTRAVNECNDEIVTELLTYDVDTNKSNNKRESPLICAIKIFSKETFFLQNDAVDILNAYSMAQAIVCYGCDVNQAITEPLFIGDHGKQFVWSHRNEAALVLKLLLISGAQFLPIMYFMKMSKFEFKGVNQLKQLLKNICFEPRSLKYLSRLSIRDVLATNIPKKVAEFNGHLPDVLIEYLLLPELNDESCYVNLYNDGDNENSEENSDDGNSDDDDDDDSDNENSEENSDDSDVSLIVDDDDGDDDNDNSDNDNAVNNSDDYDIDGVNDNNYDYKYNDSDDSYN